MRLTTTTSLLLIACLALAGCESRQAKLDKLTAQYDRSYKQYFNDCVEPAYGAAGAEAYFKGRPATVPTPQQEAALNRKCVAESKQDSNFEQQIAALRK